MAGVEGHLFSKSSEMIKKAGETKKPRARKEAPKAAQRKQPEAT